MLIVGGDDFCGTVAAVIDGAVAGCDVDRDYGVTGFSEVTTIQVCLYQTTNGFLATGNGGNAGAEFDGFQQQGGGRRTRAYPSRWGLR